MYSWTSDNVRNGIRGCRNWVIFLRITAEKIVCLTKEFELKKCLSKGWGLN